MLEKENNQQHMQHQLEQQQQPETAVKQNIK